MPSVVAVLFWNACKLETFDFILWQVDVFDVPKSASLKIIMLLVSGAPMFEGLLSTTSAPKRLPQSSKLTTSLSALISALTSLAVFPLVKFARSSPNCVSSTDSTFPTLTLLAALSRELKIVSPHDTPAALRAVIALLFPSNAPSMESSRLTDCSKFNMSVVWAVTVFVKFERFDVFCSTTVTRAVVLLSNVVLASRSVRRPLTSALFDARSAVIATVFAWRFDINVESESTSERRSETSDAFVTVFEAVLAIAASKLEFRAITLASVSLRDVMIPSMRLEFDDNCVLSSVTAPAWSN